jgi:hypothetical protein
MRTSLFIVGRTYCHPTFYPVFLPSLFQVFPEVAVLAAELSAEVVVLAAELSAEVVVLAAELSAEVSFVIAEPQVSVDIAVAFVVLVPVSVAVVEVDSSGHPKFLAVPNVDHFASSSSSVEVAG